MVNIFTPTNGARILCSVVGGLVGWGLSEVSNSLLLSEEKKRAVEAMNKASSSGLEEDAKTALKLKNAYNFKASLSNGICSGIGAVIANTASDAVCSQINNSKTHGDSENSSLISNLL